VSRYGKVVTDFARQVPLNDLVSRDLALFVSVGAFPDVVALAVSHEARSALPQMPF